MKAKKSTHKRRIEIELLCGASYDIVYGELYKIFQMSYLVEIGFRRRLRLTRAIQ